MFEADFVAGLLMTNIKMLLLTFTEKGSNMARDSRRKVFL